jgi:hypothetical protein
MRKVILLLLALTVVGATGVCAQPVPSAYVPLNPCDFYSASVSGGATTYLLARGACNVPESANAIAFVAVVSARAKGELWLWEASLPRSATKPVMSFPSGAGSSTFAIVRLCYPQPECAGEDLALYSPVATTVTLRIVGYTAPLVE